MSGWSSNLLSKLLQLLYMNRTVTDFASVTVEFSEVLGLCITLQDPSVGRKFEPHKAIA